MTITNIIYLKLIVQIMICGLSALIICAVEWNYMLEFLTVSTEQLIQVRLKKTKISYFSYKRLKLYLLSRGGTYMFGEQLNPERYIEIKIFCSILACFAGMKIRMWIGIPGAVLGFFLPDMILQLSNERDNEALMEDIKNVYDTLRIQTKAGVYLTYSLSECYLVVRQRRLKAALLELNNKIIAKKNIETAIDEFRLQFDNEYIDALCIVLVQSIQSGLIVQILTDLSVQMADVEHAIAVKEKERLDRRIQIMEILLFAGLLGICIYGLSTEITESMKNF